MLGLVPVREIAGNGFYACNNPLLWALQMHASRLACSGSPILVVASLPKKRKFKGEINRQGVKVCPIWIKRKIDTRNEKSPLLGLLFFD